MNDCKTYNRPRQMMIGDRPFVKDRRIKQSIEIDAGFPFILLIRDNTCVYEMDQRAAEMEMIMHSGFRYGRWIYQRLADKGQMELKPGDLLKIGQCQIIFSRTQIRIEGPCVTDLRPVCDVEAEELITIDYKRSPRIIESPTDEVISLEIKGDHHHGRYRNIAKRILPSLGMIIVTVFIGVITRRGLMILMCGMTSSIVILLSVADAVSERIESKRQAAAYEAETKQKLLEAKAEYVKKKAAYENIQQEMAPPAKALDQMIRHKSSKIYERKVGDEDFMRISLGYTEGKGYVTIREKKDQLTENSDDPWIVYSHETAIASHLGRRLLCMDLRDRSFGIAGSMTLIIEKLNAILLELCFFHSYHDLQIIVMADDPDDHFGWMRYLPHTELSSFHCSGMLTDKKSQEQTGNSLENLLRDRKHMAEAENRKVRFSPHLLFVVKDPDRIHHQGVMRFLLDDERQDHSVIWLAETQERLPENVTTLITYQDTAHGIVRSVNNKAVNTVFTPHDSLNDPHWEWAARNLRVFHHVSETYSGIPEMVDYYRMLDITSAADIDYQSLWERADPAKTLAVPLGMKDMEHVMVLDLHESAHGPHGLIAGTTGSGKSELLQSLILSLAVHFSPFDVGFLLIDYKGGGMADVFEGLPHLMGTITNLDAAEGVRAMTSIQAELVHRQQVFHEHHVNHIDEYAALYKKGSVREPLPHLILICDEFAELKKEHPEIITELISAARLGRSLGIHLILATQKPAGVVDDQIWSNTRFRIALRMADEADSKEILKTPDAAGIRQPGRAYLQVGNNEIYELFQSAYSSGRSDLKRTDQSDEKAVCKLNSLGQRIRLNQRQSFFINAVEKQTEVDCIVEAIHLNFDDWILRHKACLRPHPPWLPVLANVLRLPDAEIADEVDSIRFDETGLDHRKDHHDDRMNGTFTENLLNNPEKNEELTYGLTELISYQGMVDLPKEQAQIICKRDLLLAGHMAYFAAAGYGKTTWLITQTLSMACRYSPEQVIFYVLDLSAGDLIHLRNLAHIADYIAMDDEEKLAKFERLITKELKRRKRLLANHNSGNIREYNSAADQPLKVIVIMVDQADAVREMGPETEDFLHKIAREGLSLGILLMLTFGRIGGIRYATLNHISQKIAGVMNDPADISAVTGTSKLYPEEIPGRCLIRYEGSYVLMQLFTFPDASQKLTEAIERINALYPGKQAERIPMMPDLVDLRVIREMTIRNTKSQDLDTPLKEHRVKPEDQICMGLTLEMVEPSWIGRSDMPFLILGDAGRGKTNAIKVILEQLSTETACYLIDARKKDLYEFSHRDSVIYRDCVLDKKRVIKELTKIAREREDEMHQWLTEKTATIDDHLLSGERTRADAIRQLKLMWLVIDDIDDLLNGIDTEGLRLLAEAIEVLINTGGCVVVSANPSKLKGYDPVTRLIKNMMNGLLLSGQGSHNIFPMRSYKDEPEKENAILYRTGTGEKIRVAKGVDGHE